MTVIIAIIAVTLGIVCIVLAVIMIKKQNKERTRNPEPEVRYSTAMTPNVAYSDWPQGAGPSASRLPEADETEEDERSWCAEWSNGSGQEENIYSFLDSDRVDQLGDQI